MAQTFFHCFGPGFPELGGAILTLRSAPQMNQEHEPVKLPAVPNPLLPWRFLRLVPCSGTPAATPPKPVSIANYRIDLPRGLADLFAVSRALTGGRRIAAARRDCLVPSAN